MKYQFSYSINPDDIKPDETVEIEFDITLTEKVTSGSVKISGTVDYVPVIDEDYDLCKEFKKAGLTCPVVCYLFFS